jgi:multicomponent Na+:H+ antiporter subunit C
MHILLALVVGALYAGGLYMMMRRSIVKLILGLALLSHGANLLIFMMGGLTRGEPPIVAEGMTKLADVYADPLPQALILTAIVISFGVQAFAVVLIRRTYQAVGTSDLDEMQATDMPP